MDRYLLFSGSNFYPEGGWVDFNGYFSSVEDCKKHLENLHEETWCKWAHIVHKDKVILCASGNPNFRIKEWIWNGDQY